MLIAIIVVALFFALITVERIGLYGVLKALGAGSGSLFAGVLAQAVIVTLIACGIGAIAAVALAAVIPVGSIPFIATGGQNRQQHLLPARRGRDRLRVLSAPGAQGRPRPGDRRRPVKTLLIDNPEER